MASAPSLASILGQKRPQSKADQMTSFKNWLDDTVKQEEEGIVAAPTAKRARSGSDKWWELPEPTLTPALKRDLQIIQSRGYLDPKRFYKTAKEQKKLPKRFQIGTIVESAFDGPEGRLTKKERKGTIAQALLHDETFQEYGQKFVKKISDNAEAASNKGFKKRRQGRRRGKSRR